MEKKTMEDNTMLFKALREFTSGLLNQLLVNLAGQEGQIWLEELKKFLRKERCWAGFNPTAFIGEGWRFVGTPTPAKVQCVQDVAKATLHCSLQGAEKGVTGEETLRRLASGGKVALGAEDFHFFWTHQNVIPEKWKEAGVVFFDGDPLLGPRSDRFALFLYWNGCKRWEFGVSWLDNPRSVRNPSAVLA